LQKPKQASRNLTQEIETAPMKAVLAGRTFDRYRSQPRVEQLKLGKQLVSLVVATKSSI
jgi:hypothetical protein